MARRPPSWVWAVPVVVLLASPVLGVAVPAPGGTSSPGAQGAGSGGPAAPWAGSETVSTDGGAARPLADAPAPAVPHGVGAVLPPLIGPPDPNASSSTLELVNNSLAPGFSSSENLPEPGSIAFDPALDRVYVGSFESYGLAVEEVDPVAASVEGWVHGYGCLGTAESGLQYDPDNGLLYALCGPDRLLALDPANGTVLANLSLGGVRTNCSGIPPYGVGLALGSALHDVFALVLGCRNLVMDALTLDVIDDRSNSVTENISLGETNYSGDLSYFEDGVPLAFDAASGQLYVQTSYVLSTASLVITVVDPVSGDLAANLTTAWISPYPFVEYSPTLQGVLVPGWFSSGRHANWTALLRLDPVSGSATPVVKWAWPLNSTVQLVVPYAAVEGPGDTGNLTIFAFEPSTSPTGSNRFVTLVYNVSTGTEVANFTLGEDYETGVYDSVDRVMFLVEPNADVLATIEGPRWHLGPSVPLGAVAFGAAFDASSGSWYVATSPACAPPGEGILTCIQNEPGLVPETLNVTPVIEVVPSTVERSVASWPLPQGTVGGILFDPAVDELYVLSQCSTSVAPEPCLPGNASWAITSYTTSGHQVAQLPLAGRSLDWLPEGMAVDGATGNILWMALAGSSTLTLDAAAPSLGSVTTVATLTVREGLIGSVAYDPADNLAVAGFDCVNITTHAYGSCWSAFNGTTLAPVWNLTEPGTSNSAETIAFDPLNDTLFVSNGTDLFVVDPRTGVVDAAVPEPGGVTDLSFDSANNVLYFLGAQNLSEVNGSSLTILATYPIAATGFLGSVEVDPSTGVAAVTQASQGCVLFDAGPGTPRYPVEFPESGLPTSSTWGLTVGGVGQSGTGALTYFLPNGTYAYALAPPAGYVQSTLPAAGALVVDGSSVVEPTVQFRPATVPLAFVESGGVDPAGWSLTLTQVAGTPCTGACATDWSNSSTSATFSAPNGTYRYLLEGLGSGYQLTGVAPTGLVQVTGSPVTLDFGFARGPTPTIAFREGGALGGSTWCVRFAQLLSRCTANTSLRFPDLSPGAYAFSFLPPSGFVVARASGVVTLHNASVGVARPFAPQRYEVTLVGVGLALHTRWTVRIDGKTLVGREPFVAVALANGTYPYVASPVPGYHGEWSGNVTVNGTGIAVSGVYTRVLYAVTFTEEGLPGGSNWTVTVDGITRSSNTSTMTFELPNGTYVYTAAGPSLYTHPTKGSRFRVDAAPVSVVVRFRSV